MTLLATAMQSSMCTAAHGVGVDEIFRMTMRIKRLRFGHPGGEWSSSVKPDDKWGYSVVIARSWWTMTIAIVGRA